MDQDPFELAETAFSQMYIWRSFSTEEVNPQTHTEASAVLEAVLVLEGEDSDKDVSPSCFQILRVTKFITRTSQSGLIKPSRVQWNSRFSSLLTIGCPCMLRGHLIKK